jgi:hypothetical protein
MKSYSMHGRYRIHVQNCIHVVAKIVFIRALRSEILLDCCGGLLTGGAGAGVCVRGRVFKVI